jgi:catechol 2,3-dioxygenase-like lactoylglutathione lyase family enzyme
MPGSKRQAPKKKPGQTKKSASSAHAAVKRPPPKKVAAAKAPARRPPAAKPAGKAVASKPAHGAARPPNAAAAKAPAAQAHPVARQAPMPPPPQPLRRATDLSFALNKLHQVALLATNLDASVAFYRDVLGLHYMDRYDPPGLAFFNLGSGVRLILSATSSKATLYFLVDDIDSAFRVLAQRGVSFLHKPSMIHRDDEGRLGKKGIEEWMAFFKDPADNVLALVARR